MRTGVSQKKEPEFQEFTHQNTTHKISTKTHPLRSASHVLSGSGVNPSDGTVMDWGLFKGGFTQKELQNKNRGVGPLDLAFGWNRFTTTELGYVLMHHSRLVR